jgi:hypothetical protein
MQIFIMFGSLFAALCLAVMLYSTVSQAGGGKDIQFKYYKCISVPSGASLWSVSEENMDEAHYDSVEEFMNEVMYINRLDEEDIVMTGQTLIVPYYSIQFQP